MSAVFDHLLDEVRKVHEGSEALQEFGAFPDDLARQPVEAAHIPAATLMMNDRGLETDSFTALRDAFIAAAPEAHWRETYKGTRIGEIFRENFGCYCLIGAGGPFHAAGLGAYVVYMPAGLYYPFHHHPAEEIYFVIAGEAEFLLDGSAPKTLGPGEHVFHPSNRPHATQTHDKPLMALVLWRGDRSVKPILTYPEGET